jgi:hypothetical protein
VRDFENGMVTPPRRASLAAIQRALEDARVEFLAENGGGPGVRLRSRVDAMTERVTAFQYSAVQDREAKPRGPFTASSRCSRAQAGRDARQQ